MDRAGHWANSSNLPDFIELFANPKKVNSSAIADLYIKMRLSASKIAAEVGLSKAAVIRHLHQLGIRKESIADLAKEHPRPPIRAAYGLRIVDGQLISDRQEQRVARLIVELRARQGLGWKEVVANLNSQGLRTRSGIPWKVGRAKMVYDRWRDRL